MRQFLLLRFMICVITCGSLMACNQWAPVELPSSCRSLADCPGSYVCTSFRCVQPTIKECKEGDSRPCYPEKQKGCKLDKDGKYVCEGNCQLGKQYCVNDKWEARCQNVIVPVAKEECDDVDDDCDGQVDENFPNKGKPCERKVGECVTKGTYVCTPTRDEVLCDAKKPVASEEICNDKDDDCDGKIDEGFESKGESCSAGNSACKVVGKRVCSKDARRLECSARAKTAKNEECNGIDDDCDGKVDNIPNKSDPLEQECYTGKDGKPGAGICKKGKQRCEDKKWTTCEGDVVAIKEKCNDKDDDCDGQVDEDFPDKGKACQGGSGACLGSGVKACATDGSGTYCKLSGGSQKPETCNGKDDDCDGYIDNLAGVKRNGSLERPCFTGSQGCQKQSDGSYRCVKPCATGKEICSNGQWSSCQGDSKPQKESCNDKDDDCDGKIDNGDPDGGISCNISSGSGKQGQCAKGTTSCDRGKVVCRANTPLKTERCDGKDHDCDGRIDNGCVSTLSGSDLKFKDGPKADALFYNPSDVTSDGKNVWISDCSNNVVRMIDASGRVSTIAGRPDRSNGLSEGPGRSVVLRCPAGIVVDKYGDLYLADSFNNRIVRISKAKNGRCGSRVTSDPYCVTLVAGGSSRGSNDGEGRKAKFYVPQDLTITDKDVIYVTDSYNHKIRKIARSFALGNKCNGLTTTDPFCVSTLAGSRSGFADGVGTAARFAFPRGVVFWRDRLFVADTSNHKIRSISLTTGRVSTIAGSNISGFRDGSGSTAQFRNPVGIQVTSNGSFARLFVADERNHRIRQLDYFTRGTCNGATISAAYCVRTLAGSGTRGSINSSNLRSSFNQPTGLWLQRNLLYVVDSKGHQVRTVSLVVGQSVTTFAGSNTEYKLGKASDARFSKPIGLVSDSQGNLFFGDRSNAVVMRLSSNGLVSKVSGSREIGFVDGSRSLAKFGTPRPGLLDSRGHLVVVDSSFHAIRFIKLSDGSVRTTIGGSSGFLDARGRNAKFRTPSMLVSAGNDSFYVVDRGNHAIRFVDKRDSVTTIAGGGEGFIDGPGKGTGNLAKFKSPSHLVVRSNTEMYVSDTANYAIRKLTRVTNTRCGNIASYTGWCITTIAGAGSRGTKDGIGKAAMFRAPEAMVLHNNLLYIADGGSQIRVLDLKTNKVTSLTGLSLGSINGHLSKAHFWGISGMAWDKQRKALIVTESINRQLRKIVLP